MDLSESIIRGIKTLIKSQLLNASFDKTFIGVVSAVNSDGTVNVNYADNIYSNLRILNSVSIIKDNTVLCLKIQNNENNIIVLGKI